LNYEGLAKELPITGIYDTEDLFGDN